MEPAGHSIRAHEKHEGKHQQHREHDHEQREHRRWHHGTGSGDCACVGGVEGQAQRPADGGALNLHLGQKFTNL